MDSIVPIDAIVPTDAPRGGGLPLSPSTSGLHELGIEEVVPAVLSELAARCPAGGFDRAVVAGSFAARHAALRRGHRHDDMVWNDVDVYWSASIEDDTSVGITTEDSPLVFLNCNYTAILIAGHQVELNFVRLAAPFTLQVLVDDFDINAVCAGFEITAAGAGECYESAAFDGWLNDRILRPNKVQGPARLSVRLAYKAMQLGCPADYSGLDPADGEMAGEAYPKKLAALRAAAFPEPECFRGLALRRRLEDGVFANTGEPRVFYSLVRCSDPGPAHAWGEVPESSFTAGGPEQGA
jgi:hypothetical protein